MGCKCSELSKWLKEEILLLEELKRSSSQGSAYHHTLSGKLEAFRTISSGLVLEQNLSLD